jgi:hypothetical protein
MDEKKKLVIVSVLAVLLIAVGVFTMMPKGQPEPTVASDVKPEATAQSLQAPPPDAPKNPLVAANLSQRDPFSVEVPLAPVTTAGGGPGAPSNPAAFVHPTTMKELKGSLLPGATADGTSGVGGNGQVVAPAIPPFSYTVTGVVVGRKPAAVFRDPTGNQKLIAQGGQLDGDTKVESVNLRFVAVSYHGKMMKLNVGEEQSRLEGGMVAK